MHQMQGTRCKACPFDSRQASVPVVPCCHYRSSLRITHANWTSFLVQPKLAQVAHVTTARGFRINPSSCQKRNVIWLIKVSLYRPSAAHCSIEALVYV